MNHRPSDFSMTIYVKTKYESIKGIHVHNLKKIFENNIKNDGFI